MKVRKTSRPVDTDEPLIIDEVDEASTVGDTEDLVQFALTIDLKPPPRIGNVNLSHFLSVSELKKGVHKIPRNCAHVLADKGYGSLL